MTPRIQLVATIAALALFFIVFELVRRKRLMERYALLWLVCSIVLTALALWTDLLEQFSTAIGVQTPSNALFLVAFGFVLLLLLHFSLVISTLSDRSVVLAQQVGLLQQELDAYKRREAALTGGEGPAATEAPTTGDERVAAFTGRHGAAQHDDT
jgi:hypothetical protein